jgi:hypothetical protein
MDTFEVTLQHPLGNKTQPLGFLPASGVIQSFQSIDWLKWHHDANNPEDSAMVEHFYYFEAKRPGDKHIQPLLCVSGQPSTESELQAHGAMCRIDHFFLVTTISRGFLGIGEGKPKQMLSQRTMKNCTPAFAEQCLQAFLDADAAFLDKELLDNDSSFDED